MFHYAIFARDDRRHVHTDAAGPHAPARRFARVMRHLRGGHHRFRGRAAGVDAGAAEFGALDERYFPAQIGQREREWIASLSGADHDGVEFHFVPSVPPEGWRAQVYRNFRTAGIWDGLNADPRVAGLSRSAGRSPKPSEGNSRKKCVTIFGSPN